MKKMEENIIRELLREIQPAFLDGINEEIKKFRQLFDRLAEKQDNICAIENIYRMSHNIHGNGSSYGFPAISEIGERMEEALKAIYLHQKGIDETLLKFLADCVDSLEKIVQKYREQ
jgi:chemotaxis protein histidine kinase CheA